jgi:DNA-binding winged helix-turn-helix (wHTH) protein/tetratricopeptide (TPR) repeat protein
MSIRGPAGSFASPATSQRCNFPDACAMIARRYSATIGSCLRVGGGLPSMLKLSDLAGQPDFQLGPLEISPSRRLIDGPSGKANLEPIIMQALLILIDGKDNVVTRKMLFDQCWGAAAVGDDSLNRAVAKIRQTLEQVAPGSVDIETIPRTGYRLTLVDASSDGRDDDSTGAPSPDAAASRRTLIVGSVALAVASGGAFYLTRRRNPQFDALMAAGREAVHDGTAFEWEGPIANRSDRMVKLYERAVQIEPGEASAWGLLAYYRAVAAQHRSIEQPANAVEGAVDAIRQAQLLDRGEPNARVAQVLIAGSTLDMIHRDGQLRQVLTDFPDNLPAKLELMPLLQAVGYLRESYELNEQILAAAPMARQYLTAKAMKLWILGRTRESDAVIDRVRGIWPENRFAYGIRLMIFGLTGRPQAALAMLDSPEDRNRTGRSATVWKSAMTALAKGTPTAKDLARRALLDAARGEPAGVNDIIMLLGALGLVDDAYAVTEGYILWRGGIISKNQADGRAMDTYNRRMTQWLFTPTLAGMRADPRFQKLCDDFGLTAYWRARGVQPDYLRYA